MSGPPRANLSLFSHDGQPKADMESTLEPLAIDRPAEDMAAAVRDERDRTRQFLSNWRTSSLSLEQQLLSQIEATARELSQSLAGDADEAELQRKHNELADERLRLEKLKSDIAQREQQQRDLHNQFAAQHDQFAAQHEALFSRLTEQTQQLDVRRVELAEKEESIRLQLERLEQSQGGLEQRATGIETMLANLDQREQQVRQAEAALQKQSAAVEAARQQQAELEKLRGQLEKQQDHLQQEQSQLAKQRSQLQEQQAQAEEQRRRLEELHQQLDGRQRKLDDRQAGTEASRKQLARQLKLQRAEQFVEIAKKRGELELIVAGEDADFERQLGQLQDELVRLNAQTQQRGEEAGELRRQLEAARSQIEKRDKDNRDLSERLEQLASAGHHSAGETAELGARLAEAQEKSESQQAAAQAALAKARDEQQQLRNEVQQAQAQHDQAQQQIAQLQEQISDFQQQIEEAGDDAAQQRIRELERERDALVERLSDAEQVSSHGGGPDVEELRERLETALEDVRSMRKRNAELEDKLAKGVAAGNVAAGGGAMDWEAQKRRMLAQLESDFDEEDTESKEARLTVEGTINITDQVVADKDREIEELKRLLDDQSKNIGGMAVGASAIAEMLDGDQLIQQERTNLETLQQEWREKLRKAEIDISVERAKIARERAQLEAKLQLMQQDNASDSDGDGESGKKPKRGRWLARLGLGEDEK